MQVGDIVSFWNDMEDAYCMGVVMEIKNKTIIVQDIEGVYLQHM